MVSLLCRGLKTCGPVSFGAMHAMRLTRATIGLATRGITF